MLFSRKWDVTCPLKYSMWESDGAVWTIEDLHPEDDELAVQMYVTDYVPDQLMSSNLELYNDEASLKVMQDCCRKLMSSRTSLGCYRERYGKKELVAVNCLRVKRINDPEIFEQQCENVKAFKIFQILFYMETSRNLFEELSVDEYLCGYGLLVSRPYRGLGISEKLLAAREPLCNAIGLRATATVFIGPSSQECAAKCGFNTLTLVTFGKLATDAGMKEFYPKDQSRTAKLMVRKYSYINEKTLSDLISSR